MDSFIENVNTTAMVLGYPILGILIFLSLWFGTRIFRDFTKIFNEMRYERRRLKYEKRDRIYEEPSWVLEPYEDNVIPITYPRHQTLELPELSYRLHNYQEEYQ